jgi:site-specific DNA-methyltransferase (adenine-specific)
MKLMYDTFELYLGDCLEVLKDLPDSSVDLIVTDPPYDIKNTKAGGSNALCGRMNKSQKELKDLNICSGFNDEILSELIRVNKGINMYFFCNKAQIPMYLDLFVNKLGCSFDLIKWVKTNAPPTYNNKYLSDTEYAVYVRKAAYCNPSNYADASTLYHAPANVKDKRLYNHPTPKPVELLRRLIRNSSKAGDVILDPFMGSGSTGEAALLERRKFIGAELIEEHFGTASQRILEAACL